jgi:response regulator of citrate/malate metabolism
MFMAALPPLFILTTFHLVMMRVEQSARQVEATMTLAQLQRLIAETTAEYETLSQKNEEQQTMLTAVQAQLSQTQNDGSQMKGHPSLPDSVTGRRERLLSLVNDSTIQMTQEALADELGVSVSTIRRDLQALNGRVS